MKKQLLCLLALGAASSVAARVKQPVEQLIKFNTMEKGHKDDWFKFMKEQAAAKADVLKKQHDDWADFRNSHIAAMMTQNLGSAEAKEAFADKELRDAIALHEKHIAQWEAFAKSRIDHEKQLCDKHKKELEKFKAQLTK